MKNLKRTYRFLTLCFLLFTTSLFLWNCEKETHIDNSIELNTGYKISRIINFDISSNSILSNRLSKLNKSENNLARDVYSTEHDFTVDTDIVKYVENSDQSYHSYTFKVTREEDNNLIENLLASLQTDGSYKLFLIKYQLTPEGELINIEQSASIEEIEDEELSNNLFSRGCEMEFECVEGCIPSNTCHTDAQCTGEGALYQVSINCGGGGGGGDPINDPNSGTPVGDEGTGGGGGTTTGGNNTTDPDPNEPTDVTAPVIKVTAEELALDEIEECLFPNGLVTTDDFLTYNWLVGQSQIDDNTTNTSINNFLQENNCSEEAQNFADLAIEALMDGGEVDFEDQIINKLTGKAKCVYDKLKDNSLINNTLQEFDETDALINLLIEQDDLDPGTSGETEYGIPIKITLDTDDMNNAPSLWGAHTIIHEAIHADIYRKVFITGGLTYTPPNIFTLNGVRADFPTLFDYYDNYPNNAHHNYMADYYRTAMKNALKEYATLIGETYPDQLYKDLAWAGLHGTNAWNNMYADPVFTANEQARINQAITDFKNSGTNECN